MPAVLAWCESPGILESQHSSCAQGQAGVQGLEPDAALGSSVGLSPPLCSACPVSSCTLVPAVPQAITSLLCMYTCVCARVCAAASCSF